MPALLGKYAGIVMIAASLVAYQVVYLCYRNLKSWDVFRAPQDAMLQRWDKEVKSLPK